VIDLSDIDDEELYVAAFERPGGLDALLAGIKAAPPDLKTYERLYDIYTSAVRRYVAERAMPAELADLSDHLMRVRGAIARRLTARTKTAIIDRLEALEDLIDDALESVRRALPDAVLRRTHIREILLYLADRQGSSRRSDLRECFGLGEANTSRVVKLLADARFIERFAEGKGAIIKLTPLGYAAVDKIKPYSPPPKDIFIVANPLFNARLGKIIVKTPVTTIWDMLQFPYAHDLDLPKHLGLDIRIKPIFESAYVSDVLGISQRIFAREADISRALDGKEEIWAHVAPYKHFNGLPLLDLRERTMDVCVMSKYDGFPIVAMSKRRSDIDWSSLEPLRRAEEFRSLLLSRRHVTIRYLKGDEAVYVYLKAMLHALGFDMRAAPHHSGAGDAHLSIVGDTHPPAVGDKKSSTYFDKQTHERIEISFHEIDREIDIVTDEVEDEDATLALCTGPALAYALGLSLPVLATLPDVETYGRNRGFQMQANELRNSVIFQTLILNISRQTWETSESAKDIVSQLYLLGNRIGNHIAADKPSYVKFVRDIWTKLQSKFRSEFRQDFFAKVDDVSIFNVFRDCYEWSPFQSYSEDLNSYRLSIGRPVDQTGALLVHRQFDEDCRRVVQVRDSLDAALVADPNDEAAQLVKPIGADFVKQCPRMALKRLNDARAIMEASGTKVLTRGVLSP
jgi:DNA-binding MarR family transcriptional regulator